MNTLKQFVLIILILVFPLQMLQSQSTEPLTDQSKQEMYDFYMKKHKNLKTTGWVLLGGGLAATIGGAIIFSKDFTLSGGGEAGAGLFLVGTCATISSIPVFIVSGSKKRKAEAIIGTGKIGIDLQNFNNTDYVSAGLRISFL